MVLIVVKQRPIPWKSHEGFGRSAFNPRYKEMLSIRREIQSQYHSLPIVGPVCAECAFQFRVPESWSKKKKRSVLDGSRIHDQAPDTTNCWKLFEDCLKNIVFEDDRKVVWFTASKEWSEEDAIVCHIESVQEIWKRKKEVQWTN